MRLFFSFAFIFATLLCRGQKLSSQKLENYLPLIEDKFNIQFNYIDENVQQQVELNLNDSLGELLQSLEKQCQLRFEKINDERVIIRPFKPEDSIDICGYVSDQNTTNISLKVRSSITKKMVVTNEKGYFSFSDLLYKEDLQIIYEDLSIRQIPAADLMNPNCQSIAVTLPNETLNEIIIPNYLTKGITKQAQKIVLKTEDFSVLPGIVAPDILKSLEHIPSVQTPFEMASKIYIRGSTPDQNLVLWNGIRTYNQSHFFGLLSAFNPYIIKETNFYAKGVNAQYGDRLAGVIDIKSAQNVQNKFSGGAGVTMLSADAFTQIPIIHNSLSAEVAFRRSFTNLWQSAAYKPMAERVFQNITLSNEVFDAQDDDFMFYDYSIGLNAQLRAATKLRFFSLFAKNELDFSAENTSVNIANHVLSKSEGYSVQWEQKYTSKLSHFTSASYANYIFDYQFASLDLPNDSETLETKANFVNDWSAQTHLLYKSNVEQQWQLGYQFSMNGIRYAVNNEVNDLRIRLAEQRNELNTHSIFAEYQIHKKALLLQVGLRVNKYDIAEQVVIEPRIYAQYEVAKKITLNASVTRRSQAVTQIQESVTSNATFENLLWRITDNEDFPVLTAEQVSIGAVYKNKGWFIESDTYIKKLQNITTLTAGFLNPVSSDFNTGLSTILGSELFVKKKWKNYANWVSYAYTSQQSKFEAINNGDYFMSNLNIEHTFKWQHYYEFRNFQFALGWLWHTGRATTNVIALKEEGQPVALTYEALNDQNLPEYHKLDFSVLYNIKAKEQRDFSYQFGFSLQNVYNRGSILNREFRTSPGIDNEFLTVDYLSQGITPNFNLRVFW